MDGTAPGQTALRGATAIVLAATMVGLLVWYGSLTGGHSAANSLLDVLSGRLPITGTVAGFGSVLTFGYPFGVLGSALGAPASAGATQPTLADGVGVVAERVRFVYAISAVAGGWVLVRLYSHWTIDAIALEGWRMDIGYPEDRDEAESRLTDGETTAATTSAE